jgi:hypothetical protein
MTRTAPYLTLLVFFLTVFFLNPDPTQAIGVTEEPFPTLAEFSQSVQNGQPDVLRGVYVANILTLPVVQQPADRPYYVSNRNGEVTQFDMASRYGSTGLLAHNTLSGKVFFNLAFGQDVQLVYGDGRVENFEIRQILHFQALDPESISSPFRNLDRNEVISATEMFNRVYAGGPRLVFQTCIEAEGNVSWGRLFAVAVPKE